MEKDSGFIAADAKNVNPWEMVKEREMDSLIAIYFQINQLKQLFRRGWLRKNVPRKKCESVADHCFGMLVLAWFIIERFSLELDRLKVFQLVIAHEFGEVYGGDMTKHDGIPDEEKHEIEKTAIEKLFRDFPGGEIYIACWNEFSARKTDEARFAAEIDKFEMAMQSTIYGLQHGGDFAEFIISAEEAITNPALKKMIEELKTFLQEDRKCE